MPETIQGLGRILFEWREDDIDAAGAPATINEWAARLINAGWFKSRAEIAHLLDHAEKYDHWTLEFTCDCFDGFLSAMKRGIYRGSRDKKRWDALSAVMLPAFSRCLSVRDLTTQ